MRPGTSWMVAVVEWHDAHDRSNPLYPTGNLVLSRNGIEVSQSESPLTCWRTSNTWPSLLSKMSKALVPSGKLHRISGVGANARTSTDCFHTTIFFPCGTSILFTLLKEWPSLRQPRTRGVGATVSSWSAG